DANLKEAPPSTIEELQSALKSLFSLFQQIQNLTVSNVDQKREGIIRDFRPFCTRFQTAAMMVLAYVNSIHSGSRDKAEEELNELRKAVEYSKTLTAHIEKLSGRAVIHHGGNVFADEARSHSRDAAI